MANERRVSHGGIQVEVRSTSRRASQHVVQVEVRPFDGRVSQAPVQFELRNNRQDRISQHYYMVEIREKEASDSNRFGPLLAFSS